MPLNLTLEWVVTINHSFIHSFCYEEPIANVVICYIEKYNLGLGSQYHSDLHVFVVAVVFFTGVETLWELCKVEVIGINV